MVNRDIVKLRGCDVVQTIRQASDKGKSILAIPRTYKHIAEFEKAWPDKLPEALWAYSTKVRTPNQATPYLFDLWRGSHTTTTNTSPVTKSGGT